MSNEPLTSNPRVSIHEAAAVGKKLRQDHISSGAAWSFEDWLTIRYEELRRRFERACARITELESAADEPAGGLTAPMCPECGWIGDFRTSPPPSAPPYDRDKYPTARLAAEAFAEQYVDSYETIGEDAEGREGTYTPTDQEDTLIREAIRGLMADEDFVDLIATMHAERQAQRAAEGRCLSCGCPAGDHYVKCRASVTKNACPTCDSPEPGRFPTGDFGESRTDTCRDAWHAGETGEVRE